MAADYRFVRPVDEHPIPFEQEKIDDVWSMHEFDREPPSVDEAHEEYAETISERGEWHVFRARYPFGHGDITFWNSATGEAFQVNDEEGSWHHLVNLFAEIVDAEGDCRDAEYSDSLMQSGGYKQRCGECGDWWVTG